MLNFIVHFQILLFFSFYVPYQLLLYSICHTMLVFLLICKACRTFGSKHVKSREKKKRRKHRLDLKVRQEMPQTHTKRNHEKEPAIHLYKTTYYMKLPNTGWKPSFSLFNIPWLEITYPIYTLHTELLLGRIPSIL